MRIACLLATAAVLAPPALPAGAAARPGDPDRSFGDSGSVTFGQPTPSGNEQLEPLAIASARAGRILVAGRQRTGVLLMAITRGGAQDARFNPLRDPLLGGLGLEATGVVALPDGRMLVAATALPSTGAGRQDRRLAVFRLRSDGRLDRSFGQNGVAVAGGNGTNANALARDRQGRILVAGTSERGPLLARFTAAGKLDRRFSKNGVLDRTDRGATRWLDGVVTGLATLPKGRTALALVHADESKTVADIARVTSSGRLDRRFGRRGLARPAIGGLSEGASPALVAAGPRDTVLATLATAGGAGVTRLRSNGKRDSRFGRRGETRLRPDAAVPNAIVRDRQGRVLVGGTDGNQAGLVARLRPNGALDPSFGRGGLVRGHLGRVPRPNRTAFSAVTALALQPDGRILAAGVLGDEATAGREDMGLVYLTVARLLP
jgi:uncharacterized delta-60 repeat protein